MPLIPRREFLRHLTTGAMLSTPAPLAAISSYAQQSQGLPNIVIIFTDDQGYADTGLYGAEGYRTPHLDRMAREGVHFTDFYVAQPVCGASRAALLTGCYPNRIGLLGAPNHNATHGLNDGEMTIAELLKQKNYATAIYGKWHLGHREPFLPTRHGFDEYFGLPYSNDMWPFHPTSPHFPPLPLIRGEEVVRTNPDQRRLTTWYTEHAVRFIHQNHNRPFLLYLAHSMPHVPLYVTSKFKNTSEQGMYGDVIQEIDWSVGQVMKALRKAGVDENTLVIFTTDNGPWLSYGDHAGSAEPLREGKGTTWDGGVRVPCIMRWPGRIPAGSVCREPAMTIDLMPTIAQLTNTQLPGHTIDGKNIWSLMAGVPGAESPQEAYYFYWGRDLQAVRSGKWKLHFPHKYRTLNGRQGGTNGVPVSYEQSEIGLALYDLEEDIGETTNIAEQHPEVVQRLQTLADQARHELGDGDNGEGFRPPGRL